jgi:hypothetical protein
VFFDVRKDDARNPELVLNPLALAASQIGWRIAGVNKSGLTIESEQMVDPDSVNAMSDQMDALAREFGVEFDGWECAVMTDEDFRK